MVLAALPLLGAAACGGGEDGDEGGSASIEGSVIVDGAPVAGARVAMDAVEEDEEPDVAELEPLAETETDEGGDYRLTDVEPGDYLVFADVEGCRILVNIEVEEDTVTVDFEIPSNYTPTGPLSLLPDGNILAC